jgi:hypothetical protein
MSAPTSPALRGLRQPRLPLLEDENIFQKSASKGVGGIAVELQPWRPIFEKYYHLREKGGVLMLLKTTHHLEAKAQYVLYPVPAS